MAQVQNKENLTIAIREYTDNQGQTKKVWKTIGELITWDDGKKSFELWGPTGSQKGSVFEQNDNNNNQPHVQQGGYQNQPAQQNYNQNQPQPPQGGYVPPHQQNNNNAEF